MKVHYFIFLLFPIIFLFCSHTTEPENNAISQNIQLEFLKRIFQLEVNNHWKYEELNYYKRTGEDLLSWSTEEEFYQKLKDENNDISFLRVGVLLLSTGRLEETEKLLLDFLNKHEDDLVRFNAARALAYRGRKDGVELLRSCASGKLVLTTSSFEINAAALALLLLNEDLPKEYSEWSLADPLYLMLP